MATSRDLMVPPEGWTMWENRDGPNGEYRYDPFEQRAGPFWNNAAERSCALYVEERHLNGGGAVHGGCLATLADMALFFDVGRAVTVSLTINYIGAARMGDWLVSRSREVRKTKHLVFCDGEITAGGPGGRLVATFSGVGGRFSPAGVRTGSLTA